jgi:RNase P subunit RPR2
MVLWQFCIAPPGTHPLQSSGQDAPKRSSWELRLTTKEESRVALTCPSCGNDQNFLVKTLQMHVVHLDDSRVEVSEEGRPQVLEVLCDECETALKLEDMDEGIRKELLLTLGAR